MIYCFYLFNTNGVCLYYEDWNRANKPRNLQEVLELNMFSLSRDLPMTAVKTHTMMLLLGIDG
jgi:hypothetical protein